MDAADGGPNDLGATVDSVDMELDSVEMEGQDGVELEPVEGARASSGGGIFAVGDGVEANYRGEGEWYAGYISAVSEDEDGRIYDIL